MISYADTDEMKNISKELRILSQDLEDAFGALFARLSKVPEETKEWVGKPAKYFFETITQDEAKYKALSDRLKQISAEIETEANSIDAIINECNSD